MSIDFHSLQLDTAVQSYFDILYTCDLDQFDRLFHPDCHVFAVADGAEQVLSTPAYREVLAKRVSPQSQGHFREEAVLGLHRLSPDIAMVEARVRIGTRVFRDHLHFIRAQGQWRLAAKLYSLEQLV
jgi:hypothetical protein